MHTKVESYIKWNNIKTQTVWVSIIGLSTVRPCCDAVYFEGELFLHSPLTFAFLYNSSILTPTSIPQIPIYVYIICVYIERGFPTGAITVFFMWRGYQVAHEFYRIRRPFDECYRWRRQRKPEPNPAATTTTTPVEDKRILCVRRPSPRWSRWLVVAGRIKEINIKRGPHENGSQIGFSRLKPLSSGMRWYGMIWDGLIGSGGGGGWHWTHSGRFHIAGEWV